MAKKIDKTIGSLIVSYFIDFTDRSKRARTSYNTKAVSDQQQQERSTYLASSQPVDLASNFRIVLV